MPKLKAMLELRELKQFHKVFLQNQLCKNLQNAMADLKARNSHQSVQLVSAAHLSQQSSGAPSEQAAGQHSFHLQQPTV